MHVVPRLTKFFTQLISETSGLSLADTLALAEHAPQLVLTPPGAHEQHPLL